MVGSFPSIVQSSLSFHGIQAHRILHSLLVGFRGWTLPLLDFDWWEDDIWTLHIHRPFLPHYLSLSSSPFYFSRYRYRTPCHRASCKRSMWVGQEVDEMIVCRLSLLLSRNLADSILREKLKILMKVRSSKRWRCLACPTKCQECLKNIIFSSTGATSWWKPFQENVWG